MAENPIKIDLKVRLAAGNLSRKLCHLFTYINDQNLKKVELSLHWGSTDFAKNNHYEDVESWVEKATYLINQLNISSEMNITHHLDNRHKAKFGFLVGGSKVEQPQKYSNKFVDNTSFSVPKISIFKKNLKTQKDKVCFWRYDKSRLTNHRNPNQYETWYKENTYTPDEWWYLYIFLNDNYNVVELEYRTPIREVFYHLSTCEFVVGYGGMWHILSNYLDNPMISILNPSRIIPNDHRHIYENVCLPTIDEITDLDYFKSLVYEAQKRTRLAQSGLTEWKLN